ncbi:amidase [Vibrio viridaestus]|uniref:Amidase n=1 Tax=Vibrio viridaestus TaxID=2487322 RepID=A0A3N9TF70_9VIBR|nr:amidase [Vibrio viridaestus]RQW62373.1 amidase [Vibrio viridaestus]
MDKVHSLNKLGLVEMLKGIEAGDFTACDIINACFDQIDARETDVGAWQFKLSREDFLAQYRQNETFYQQSLLKGLPVGIKDIIDTKGMPTEMGSGIHNGRIPGDDATCVELIKQAGGIVLGKTVTTEFAYFKPGKTKNPADLSRTPGGSSSGSAAAVADNMVPITLGSQTAASVIRPAAYCGSIGYVASRGDFSLRGCQPLAQSLDSLGAYARRIEDLQFLRSILLRTSVNSQVLSAIKPTKILFCLGEQVGDVDPEMEQALKSVASTLAEQSVELVPLEDQGRIRRLVSCHETIMAWEVCRNLAKESLQPESMSEPLQALMKNGLAMSRADFIAAQNEVSQIQAWLKATMQGADAILAPAAPGVAPVGHEKTGAPHMSRPWQVLGLPTVTLSGVTNKDHLPLGLQLIGQQRADEALLQIAKWCETVVDGVVV